MKKTTVVMMLVLIMTFSVAGLAGCGRDYVDDENTVIIDFYEGGYGREFIDQMAREFEAQHEGKKIAVKATPIRKKILDVLESGPLANDADIVITNGSAYELLGKGKELGYGNDYIFEPLTEVFDDKGGTDKALRDRFYSSYYPVTQFKDKEYMLIWSAGIQGLIYHEEMFEGKTLPRTTEELISVAEQFKGEGKNAFVYSGQVDYWNALHLTWWAQYQGKEEYFKFYSGLANVEYPIGSGSYVEKLSPNIFLQAGREESLNVMARLLDPDKKLCDPESTAINFSDAQNKFLQKKAAMHPNGDWIESEAETTGNYVPGSVNVKFMKTPVISSLGTKLKISEAELIATIDYVDGVTTQKPTYNGGGVDQEEVIARVAEARNMVYLSATTHIAGIPSYSNAIPLAKEFLKFMYSNRGAEIFASTTGGATLPVEYDYTANAEVYAKFSKLHKSRIEFMNETAVGIYQDGSNPLCYRGLMKPYSYNDGVLEAAFGATNVKDRKTPAYILAEDVTKYNADGWQSLLDLSGYLNSGF